MQTIKRLKQNTYLIYTLLFIIIAFLAFFWFIYVGNTFVHNVDGYLQHYSFLVKLRRFVSDIVHGNGVSLWSWDAGYGADTIGNFAIVFCDPFAYIAAAFKPQYIDIGYSISEIVRLYVAGLAMIAFLKYRKKSFLQCVIGGISYALSSWAVASMVHAFFLNPLVFFPLLILGVDKIDKEKNPFVFVAAIFFSLITSFYFSYMSALLTIVYIVIKYFLENENQKSISDFLKRFIKFVFYAILGVAIASVIFIPVFYTLVHANKSSGVDINLFLNLKELTCYIPSFVSNIEINSNYSYTTFSMICLAMVPAAIIDFKKGINRLPSLMALICIVMVAFPIFGSIFNALSYSVGRWCYMLAFFFVWASVSALDLDKFKNEEYKKSYKTILVVIVIVIAVALIVSKLIFNVFSDESLYIGIMNLLFLLVFGYVVCSSKEYRKISKSAVVITLMVINLGLMYFIKYSPNLSNYLSNFMPAGDSYKQYSIAAHRAGAEIADNDFYRIDQVENSTSSGYEVTVRLPANENLFFNTRSIYSYISTIDNRIFEYHKALCNSAGYNRRVCFYSNDNRSRINYLQGVKYFIGNDKKKNSKTSQYAGYGNIKYKTIDGVKVLKNKYNASLGYVFENTISENNFMKYDYLDREQIMMQACVVPDNIETNASVMKESNLDLNSKNIDYKIESQSGLSLSEGKIKVKSIKSRLTISTGTIKNSEVYIVFRNLKKKPFSYNEYKKYCLNNKINSKIASYIFDANNISYSPYGNFDIFVQKSKINRRLFNSEGTNQGINGIKDYIANLGYYESTEGNITIDFKSIGDYTFDSIEVIAVSQENFDAQAKTLENNRLKVSTLHDNYIKGTVSAENDGMLYLSIPYTKGWKVYIDGKEQETYIADIAFTGVDIDKGEHTVELKYRPIGFKVGLFMSMTGIVVFAVILIYKKVKKENGNV